MDVVEDLVQARLDYERGDWARALDTWADVDADAMDVADLHDAAVSAYLLGQRRRDAVREAADQVT